MKHLFIINPASGKGRRLAFKDIITQAAKKLDIRCEIYISESGGRVSEKAACFAKESPDGRIYAVGGDGTFNLAVNGLGPYSSCQVGVIPVGTGNDFAKNLPCRTEDLQNIEKMLTAPAVKTDLILMNGSLCTNAANIGFDAMVGMDMPKFKKIPFISNQGAYYASLFYTLVKKLGIEVAIEADGELFYKGRVLMSTVSNGRTCGGGFVMAPDADITDGLIDLSLSLVPSRSKLMLFLKNFTAGTQNSDPRMAPYIMSKKCKEIKIYSDRKFALINDGEGMYRDFASFKILPGALNLILPQTDK